MTTLIYDEDQVKEFYNRVLLSHPMKEFDTDFFCVAARKKYMTEKEREATRLGDTALLEKTILKKNSLDVFLNKLHKVDAGLDWLTSNNGTRIPRSCMVFYMNINHTNMIYALKSLKIDLAVLEGELLDCLNKRGSLENIGSKVKGLNTLVLKAYQDPKNTADKFWVDVDFDISPENFSYKEILSVMKSFNFSEDNFVVIQTRGGYHILVSTSGISEYNRNYAQSLPEGTEFDKRGILSIDKILKGLSRKVVEKGFEAKEIILNKNGMVPIPGTLQGGVKVKLLRNED